MLDLGRLRVLHELKLRGTVGAVAEALGYTPSAVSQQLARLQQDVDVRLVERAGRRLRLTEAGEVLAGRAESLLADARRAEEEALAAAGRVAGTVKISGFQSALTQLVAPVLPGLTVRHPELTVQLVDRRFPRVPETLVRQEADIVLTSEFTDLPSTRPGDPTGDLKGDPTDDLTDDVVGDPPGDVMGDPTGDLTGEVLLAEPARLALPASHRLAAGTGPIRIADLANDPWAAGRPGGPHFEMVERACARHGGFRPDIRVRSDDLLVQLALVGHGQVVGLIFDLGLGEAYPGVALRRVDGAGPGRRVFMWTRRSADVRPSIRVVLEALRTAADDLTARVPCLSRERRDDR